MSSEVFNPNPTIFVTPNTSTRRPARNTLWMTDSDDSSYESDDEIEPIDGDEVFGEHPAIYVL
jgi:hypothetical protein